MRRFLIALAAVAAGCAAPPRPAPPAAAAPAPAGPFEAWAVEDARLEIRVYRDGPLARLGHDHLIVSDAVTGRVEWREPRAASGFSLELPLASLEVDDPAARAAAGGRFGAPVPAEAREATARNLRGPGVLDAARQPVIRMAAAGFAGGPTAWRARVRVSLRGGTHVVEVPFRTRVDGDRLEVRARFTLRHAELGLEPYTVALGALSVREDFDVDLALTARRGT